MGTWLRWTGQQQRLTLLSAWVAIGSFLMLATADGWLRGSHVGLFLAMVGGVVLWLTGVVGLCLVRCPNCHERVVWRGAHNRHDNPARRGLLAWDRCPLCGYSAVERESAAHLHAPRVALTCLVKRVEGKLMIVIPLEDGGRHLVACARGISYVRDDALHVEIREWLSGVLRVEDGDMVTVDNTNGKFTICAVNARPIH
jgi:predicted RNA-binding Zn-ribbon protein involved in translation (DUF1610 family)